MKKLSRNVYEEITNHKDFHQAVKTFERIIRKAAVRFQNLLTVDSDAGEFELDKICREMMINEMPSLEKGMLIWICNNYIPQYYNSDTQQFTF